ncbi:MAG TPA: DUF2071 domain-containing protein [Gemmataceae bacterium]|nr:DUF2071 domain-containing protein [Gemmataceae bacterium]
MRFLTARWSNLFLATYAVPPELLLPRLPAGLELDYYDGKCFVSLVGFDFLDTKVLGVPWPGFRNFPEINFRFYVRHGEQRGVVFIREMVPSPFVSWLARMLYHEPYQAMPITRDVTDSAAKITTVLRMESPQRMNLIRAAGAKPAFWPNPESAEHFLKEQEWGFGTNRRGHTTMYRVEHPPWEVYPVSEWDLDWDWAGLYGPEWAFLADAEPHSVMLAAGSPVSVFWGKPIDREDAKSAK